MLTGLFGWLIGYRLLVWWDKTGNALPKWKLLALSGVTAALTFIAEAIALGIQASVSPLRVLESAFDFDFDMIRPGWLVLGAGFATHALSASHCLLTDWRPTACFRHGFCHGLSWSAQMGAVIVRPLDH